MSEYHIDLVADEKYNSVKYYVIIFFPFLFILECIQKKYFRSAGR